MSERPVEPPVPPREASAKDASSNMMFGLGLFALSLLLFAGTIAVALVYLMLD